MPKHKPRTLFALSGHPDSSPTGEIADQLVGAVRDRFIFPMLEDARGWPLGPGGNATIVIPGVNSSACSINVRQTEDAAQWSLQLEMHNYLVAGAFCRLIDSSPEVIKSLLSMTRATAGDEAHAADPVAALRWYADAGAQRVTEETMAVHCYPLSFTFGLDTPEEQVFSAFLVMVALQVLAEFEVAEPGMGITASASIRDTLRAAGCRDYEASLLAPSVKQFRGVPDPVVWLRAEGKTRFHEAYIFLTPSYAILMMRDYGNDPDYRFFSSTRPRRCALTDAIAHAAGDEPALRWAPIAAPKDGVVTIPLFQLTRKRK